jgi:hypothetical protein
LKDNVVVWKHANNAELVIDLLPHILAKEERRTIRFWRRLFHDRFTITADAAVARAGREEQFAVVISDQHIINDIGTGYLKFRQCRSLR